MKKAILCIACAAILTPSIAMARRRKEPPHNPPPLERHGRAVVNASCTFSAPANGLVSCAGAPLVAIPSAPPAWITSPCFYLTDFTASNFGSAGGDVISLNDGKTPANTKVVYNVAQGATVLQDFQSPIVFGAGLVLPNTNVTAEVVSVTGY